MTALRILAAAQTIPRRGDVAANVEAHILLIRAAAEAQVQVLVFPELSLTGYELDLAAILAFSLDDARLEPLRALAAACHMTVIVGAPVRIEPHLYLGALVLAPDRPVDLYTKQHLGAFPPEVNPGGTVPPAEASVFQPGDRDPLVRFGGHTAAIAVCADTGRPAHPQAAAERGATTYLASMFFTPPELTAECAKLRGYAQRHAMTVVLSNFGGPTGGLDAAGGSAIWSGTGDLVVQLEGPGAGLAIAVEQGPGWRGKTPRVAPA